MIYVNVSIEVVLRNPFDLELRIYQKKEFGET